MPNICKEQTCEEILRRKDHYLCRAHWDLSESGDINECPECGVYKDSRYEYCIKCNKRQKTKSTSVHKKDPGTAKDNRRSGKYSTVTAATFSQRASLLEDDPKAEDKRLLFHNQKSRCVYCGNKYRYDELEIEHMIPKSRGGPDHIRNCQLSCTSCNKAKGTMTDIEFREKHARHLPQQERRPATPPIDPTLLSTGAQKSRRFSRARRRRS